MNDMIAQAAADFESRAIMLIRALGAHEALWAQEGTSFKTLADVESIPAQFRPISCPSETLSSIPEWRSGPVGSGAFESMAPTITLYDDVITTGKSFKCCGRRLRDAIPASVPIIGLFVARRMLRNPVDDFEYVG